MFDPYRKWLGISAKDQPPNHYRLLGVELFESDLDVIEGAADKQMAFIRQYQSGEHAAAAAKILNELATARLCLLKPATKAAYDNSLRQQQPQQAAPNVPAKPAIPDLAVEFDLPETSFVTSKKSKGLPIPLLIGGAAVVILGVGAAIFFSMGGLKGLSGPEQKVTSVPPKTADPVTDGSKEATEKKPAKKPVLLLSSKVTVDPAGPAVDMIKSVDLARDVAGGEWKQTTSALIGSRHSRVYLPVKTTEDYQLKYRIRRVDGLDTLIVGFMMGGRQGMIILDGWRGQVSGLCIDGRDANSNSTSRPGRQFSGEEIGSVVLTVHPRHLHVTFNNQQIIDWHGDPERLLLHYGSPSRECPFLCTGDAGYVVESAELVPLKPEARQSVERLDQEIDLLAQLDMEKELPRGIWGLNENTLTSPESDGVNQLTFPVVTPEEYTLSAKVLRPEGATGQPYVLFGLVAGKSACRIVAKSDEVLGLDLIDSRHWHENQTRLEMPLCKPGKAVNVDCTVTKQGVRVEVDGRTVIDWEGDLSRLSPEGEWAPADSRRLYLGTRSQYQFSEVKLGPPLPRPALPKHVPITTEKPVDLLALIDPDRDARQGTWKKAGRALLMMADTDHGKLIVPADVPEEYRLTVGVARETGGPHNNEVLILTLPTGRIQADLVIDGSASRISGLLVGKANYDANSSTFRGAVIPEGLVTELEIEVRKTGIKVFREGKAIVDWNENTDNLALHPAHGLPGRRIGLSSYKQRFRFEKLQIRALPPSSFPSVPSEPPAGNLLPLVDLARDTREGQWTLKDNSLISPAQYEGSRFRIPFVPPQNCIFEAIIERISGNEDLLLGVTIGGEPCLILFDGAAGKGAGLETVDGKGMFDELNLATRKYASPLFPIGRKVKIRCEILPDTLIVRCGEQEVLRWHGNARRLGMANRFLPPNYSETDRVRYWIGSWKSAFHFHDLQMRSMTDEEVAAVSKSFSGVFPTTAQSLVPLTSRQAGQSPASTLLTGQEPLKRLPVPGKSAIDAAQSKVTKAYAADIKNAQRPETKVALAEKLEKAAVTAEAPVDRYAHFVEAREIYMSLGDWLNAFRVADLMSADFELGRYEEKADLVQRLAKKATGAPQHRIVAIVCWKLAADAAADEDYATAKEVCQRAVVAARSASESSLQSRATEQLRHYDTLLNQWKAAQAAEQTLKQNAEDAGAHTRIGEYLCWVRREWDEGLLSLGRTTDAMLAEVVKSDLANPVQPTDRVALAGKWLAFAKSQKNSVTKASAAVRATTWFELVVPVLEGDARMKAEEDLESAFEVAYGRAFKKVLAQKPNGVEVDLSIDCNEAVYPLKLGSSFDIRKSWLLSLEFNPINLDGGWHQIFFWGDGAAGDDPVWLRLDGNRLSAVVENTSENRGQWIDHHLPGTAIGQWHDLKFVYDGVAGNIELYIDHKLIRRESLTVMPYADRAMPLFLGGTDPGGQRYSGKVRNVWFGNLP